jgi:PTS system glucose-specific IIA component
MGFFDKLFGLADKPHALYVDDSAIVAPATGEIFDVKTLPDPMFADEMLGKSIAMRFEEDSVIFCSPANGQIRALFPTGHAFGIVTNEGVEILVHIGIDTVMANGNGFQLYQKRQGDTVKAGEPIVKADLKKLSASYNTSVIIIITNANGKEINFRFPQ